MQEPQLLETIRQRFSVRSYADKPIEDEKLNLILEAGRLAPSATNSQPWHFYVVKNKAKIKEVGSNMPMGTGLFMNSFISKVPIIIVATAGPIDLLHRAASFMVNKKWYFLDIGIALEHMVLIAWELGIGSCWVGIFNEKNVKKSLNIPKNEEVVAMLTLGYPKEGINIPQKKRKSLEDIIKTF